MQTLKIFLMRPHFLPQEKIKSHYYGRNQGGNSQGCCRCREKDQSNERKREKLTAYHEAGHAILFDKLETQDPVHEISIIPTGMAGGYTMPLPSEDKSYNSRRGMYEDIVVSLGGRVAEELIMDDISTGASNDIEKATKTARAMVTKYGMTKELGCVCYGTDNNSVFLGRDMGSRTQDYSRLPQLKSISLFLIWSTRHMVTLLRFSAIIWINSTILQNILSSMRRWAARTLLP